ncbi:MAG: bifunctional enoyl-CoA hydratase/phosphate acetyltransferase [Breznakibacter sp.]|nr:bifunctional enoyl-CoA hydratase/phosphate acetyltransferase [Breznakibacter sp.]
MFKHLSELSGLCLQRNRPKRLVLTISQDLFSLGAISKANQMGIITPILVGDEALTKQIIKENNIQFTEATFINVLNTEECVKTAVSIINRGEGDILMKGKVATATLIKGVLNRDWGLRAGKLLSHFALFEVPAYHKLFAITDVALNIAPNLKDKIAIINNSVSYLNGLGVLMPKVAVLGAIESVNENMQATLDAALLSKMNQRDQIVNCIIDGPLAFDNAVSTQSADLKGINSPVAGDTDILLMPDIEVGNVLYKSLVFFAKAKVASVILGAKAPIVLTSRSDSEESKFDSIMLAALA